jgi:DNA-binding NtrC family response regulator
MLDLFARYRWPGNVRELENTVRRLVMLGHVGVVYEDIVRTLTTERTAPAGRAPEPAAPEERGAPGGHPGLREVGRMAASAAERKALSDVLQRVRWNRKEAARVLKVSYKTLLVKIAEYGLDERRGRHASPVAPVSRA